MVTPMTPTRSFRTPRLPFVRFHNVAASMTKVESQSSAFRFRAPFYTEFNQDFFADLQYLHDNDDWADGKGTTTTMGWMTGRTNEQRATTMGRTNEQRTTMMGRRTRRTLKCPTTTQINISNSS